MVAGNLQAVARKAGYGEMLSYIARYATPMVAAIAEVRGRAGNCDDQSCVAFVYLLDNKVRPLDWMHLTNQRHSFVLIGRDGASGADPAGWGEDVVVCDPWNDAAYHLDSRTARKTLLDKMKCGCATAESVLRVG